MLQLFQATCETLENYCTSVMPVSMFLLIYGVWGFDPGFIFMVIILHGDLNRV